MKPVRGCTCPTTTHVMKRVWVALYAGLPPEEALTTWPSMAYRTREEAREEARYFGGLRIVPAWLTFSVPEKKPSGRQKVSHGK